MLADALRALIARYEYDGIPNDSLPTVEAARKALAEHDCPSPSAQGPAELWLQLHGDCHEIELSEPVDYTSDDVTWCWHRINASDVRYLRADLAGNAGAPPTPELDPRMAFCPACFVEVSAAEADQQTLDARRWREHVSGVPGRMTDTGWTADQLVAFEAGVEAERRRCRAGNAGVKVASSLPVADAEIKMAYVMLFGSDADWLDVQGSWFIEGYKAGKKDARGVLVTSTNQENNDGR